jgi:hypothetical protein
LRVESTLENAEFGLASDSARGRFRLTRGHKRK